MSGSNSPNSPILKKGVDGPAPKAQPEDTSDDTMALNPGDQQVQFVSGQNADARVEIGDSGPPKFVGLGKEELMKYANDPFWVRLRWILFVLFWLLWIAMLAGAIIIIVKAPQCANKTTGPNSGPYYELSVEDFTRDGKFSGLEAEIPFLKKMNVKSVMVSNALASSNGAVTNFKDTNSVLGSVPDFASVIQKLKDAGIAVVMQFVPNHSSDKHEWFGSQEDYYVRVPKSTESTWASQLTLNQTGSAWSEDPKFTNTKYLHQFRENQPDLNLRNEAVIKELNSALAFWYSKGVDGFLLSDVSYLLEDLNKLNDQSATVNQGNAEIVKKLLDNTTEEWKALNSESNREGPFALLEVNNLRTDKSIGYYSENAAIVNTELANLNPGFSSEDLKKILDSTITKVSKFTLHWRIGSPNKRAAAKFGADRAAVLALVAASARGHYVHYYGDEFGSTDSSANFKDLERSAAGGSSMFFEELLEATHKFNQTHEGAGETKTIAHMHGISNNFVMKRQNSQNKYIILVNLGDAEHEVDFEELRETLGATVLVRTPNLQTKYAKGQVFTGPVQLPANSGVLLRLEEAKKE